MKRLFLIALALVVGAVVLSTLFTIFNVAPRFQLRILLSEDEPPIIVKNGTMDIMRDPAAQQHWTWRGEERDNNDEKFAAFSYQPPAISIYPDDVGFWVKVTAPDTPCTGASLPYHAAVVQVTYLRDDNTTYRATFQRQRRGIFGISYRVNVRPGKDLTPQTGGDALHYAYMGHISELTAGQLKCTFGSAEDLTEIKLCAEEYKCAVK